MWQALSERVLGAPALPRDDSLASDTPSPSPSLSQQGGKRLHLYLPRRGGAGWARSGCLSPFLSLKEPISPLSSTCPPHA